MLRSTPCSYAMDHNRHAKLHVLCDPASHLQAYHAAAAAADEAADEAQTAMHLVWQRALLEHAATPPSTLSYSTTGLTLPAAATTQHPPTASSLPATHGLAHMAAFSSPATVAPNPATPLRSSTSVMDFSFSPATSLLAALIISAGSDARWACAAAATQSYAADKFSSFVSVAATGAASAASAAAAAAAAAVRHPSTDPAAVAVFYHPCASSEHDTQNQPFAALLSAILPATIFRRSTPAAAVTVLPLLAPSAQECSGADVDWLGPPQCRLNAYTGELLLETARQRLGGEPRKSEQASLALRQFFDRFHLFHSARKPAGTSNGHFICFHHQASPCLYPLLASLALFLFNFARSPSRPSQLKRCQHRLLACLYFASRLLLLCMWL